jgi:hypothetical protein
MWRARFGRGFGPVVRLLNEYIYIYIYILWRFCPYLGHGLPNFSWGFKTPREILRRRVVGPKPSHPGGSTSYFFVWFLTANLPGTGGATKRNATANIAWWITEIHKPRHRQSRSCNPKPCQAIWHTLGTRLKKPIAMLYHSDKYYRGRVMSHHFALRLHTNI